MWERFFSKLEQMAEEQNARNGIFKLQFSFGNLITLLMLLVAIGGSWTSQISADARSHQSLETISLRLDRIDETARMAILDDDRLRRLTEDVKEIRERLGEMEKKLK